MTFKSRLADRFTHHSLKAEKLEKCARVRDAALGFADLLDLECPYGRELSLALMKIEEAVFWANAGISRPSDAEVLGAKEPDPSSNSGPDAKT